MGLHVDKIPKETKEADQSDMNINAGSIMISQVGKMRDN